MTGLRACTQTLSQAANRSGDFIARIGGEEFVWLLPDTTAEKARGVVEKCLKLIRQQQISHPKSDVSALLNLSLGVGATPPKHDETALRFVEKVDGLLYQVKRSCRMGTEYADFSD